MNVLVTGGAGFIGSVTVKKLLAAGHTVTVFDNLENGHKEAVDSRARFIKGDLRSAGALRPLLSQVKFETVIHFAGSIESGESMRDPLKFFENNFSAGLNLLSSLKEGRLKKIIFSSTAGVYGDGQPPFTEESAIKATSYYSLSKYFFEQALAAAARVEGFQVVILRYFNAAGALADGLLGEAHNPETHLIPLVIKTALGLIPSIRLFGVDYETPDGSGIRDYVHVEDLAAAHLAAFKKFSDKKNSPGFLEIYNVGTGRGYSNLEVIEAVKRVSGRDFEVIKEPRRPGDWPSSFADASKIVRELGWQAQFGLPEIVQSAYRWHQSHPYGFSSK